LRDNGELIMRYRVPAENQTLILTVFQVEGWPEFIDDPLPQKDDLAPRQRLVNTSKSLNRNQLVNAIESHGSIRIHGP
jgi:hypothetical protein